MPAVALSPDVIPIVAPAILAFEGIQVREQEPRMDRPIAESAARLRTRNDLAETITLVRAMYRRFGVDPTKSRPSSEALLRRLRKGDALPRVNAVVDLCNWCSVETQLPFGLYDLDRVAGSLEIRLGGPGEGYDGIRKDHVNVEGRLTLVDAQGPFGNPTSDSARTMVTGATERVLFVIYAPRGAADSYRAWALDLTASRVREFIGGTEAHRALL
jgi:DNA/RNA-binding domain of Phe-tRNA-synthetase-like protein